MVRFPLEIEQRRPRRRHPRLRRIARWTVEALTGFVIIGGTIGAVYVVAEFWDWIYTLVQQ